MSDKEKVIDLLSKYLTINSEKSVAGALELLNHEYSGWDSLQGFQYTPDEMLIEWLEKELKTHRCVHLTNGGDCFLAELDGYKRVECIRTKGKECRNERFE